MMIYTNNQIPEFTGLFFSLSCVAFDVAASLCRCNNSLSQKISARALHYNWTFQLWMASTGRHDMNLHMKSYPGYGKCSYTYQIGQVFTTACSLRFLEVHIPEMKNKSLSLEYTSTCQFSSPPLHFYFYQTDNDIITGFNIILNIKCSKTRLCWFWEMVYIK